MRELPRLSTFDVFGSMFSTILWCVI